MARKRTAPSKKSSSSRPPRTQRAAPTLAIVEDESQADRRNGTSFPIVGIGASAGGVEALTQLFRALPPDTGMGFIIVLHLDPTHGSMLTEILARATRMPVAEVTNRMPVAANHVYVIPPGSTMIISNGILQLSPRKETRGQHRAIDLFLRSLAQDQRHAGIGVILSGSATDGTHGLEEIKAEGG